MKEQSINVQSIQREKIEDRVKRVFDGVQDASLHPSPWPRHHSSSWDQIMLVLPLLYPTKYKDHES